MRRPKPKTAASLYSHQRENLAMWRKLARGFSLLPYGAGKTPICIQRLRDLVPPRRALIVTTTGTLGKWEREVQVWGDPTWSVVVLHGTRRTRWRRFLSPHNVAIINYDGLLVLGKALLNQYNVVVFDEVHRLKNPAAKTSRGAAALGASADAVYACTGSPILESPLDAYSVMRAVNPQVWGPDYYRWRERYFEYRREKRADGTHSYPKWMPRDGTMATLSAALHGMSYYKPVEELDIRYPRVVTQPPLRIHLPPTLMHKYREVERDLVLSLKDHPEISLLDIRPRLQKLCQLARGWCYVKGADGVRRPVVVSARGILKAVCEHLEDVRGVPIVIWATHVPEMALLQGAVHRMGLKSQSIHGSTPVSTRTQVIDAFNDGGLNVLIAHPRCIGEGVDLEAGHAFRFSMTWSLLEYHQSNGRTTRASSRAKLVTRRDLVAHSTVDDLMIASIRRKRSFLQEILDRRALPKREEEVEPEQEAVAVAAG